MFRVLAFLTAAAAWGTATWIAYDKGHPGWAIFMLIVGAAACAELVDG